MDPRAASAAVATAAEAGRNPALWGEVALAVSDALGGDSAALAFFGSGGALVRACPRTNPDLHSRYDAEMHALNYLWAAAAALPAGRAVSEAMLGGRDAYRSSAIFNEFIRPQAMDSVVLLTLTNPRSPVTGILTVGRRARREPFDSDDIADGTALADALARTITATSATWRLSPQPDLASVGLLVTPGGRLLNHPDGLDRLIGGGVLSVRGGMLSAGFPPGLGAALAAAGRAPTGWPPPLGIVLGPVGTPLGAFRFAVTPGGASAPGAVRVSIEPLPATNPVDALAARFRMTPRETEIAVRLGEGETLPEVAAALGIGLTTARTHLVRLFDKTGTRSQLALALLVARHLDT